MKKLFLVLFLVIAGVAQADLESDRAKADSYLEADSHKKAFKAYRDLARDGDHYSQYKLSELYAVGKGVKGNLIDAYAWSVLASESGLDKAEIHKTELLAKIEDKEKAEFEARKLMNKYGKEAMADKAAAIAARENGRRAGACTGSRLRCRGVAAYSKSADAVGPPPVDPAGG